MKHPVTKIRKRRKKQVIEAFGGECQMCGYKKNENPGGYPVHLCVIPL